MEKMELDEILKVHDEYKVAIDATEGKVLPEDERASSKGS